MVVTSIMFLIVAIILAQQTSAVPVPDKVGGVAITNEDLVFLKVGGVLMVCNGYSELGMVYQATTEDIAKIKSIGGKSNTRTVKTGDTDLALAYLVCDIGSESTKIGITENGVPMKITGDTSEASLAKITYPCGDDSSVGASLDSWKQDMTRVIGSAFRLRLTSQYDFNKIVFIVLIAAMGVAILIIFGLIVALSVKQHRRQKLNAMMAATTTRDGLDYSSAAGYPRHAGLSD